MPALDDFELAETPIPTPAHGQVLVRNIFMSVDPYMRGRMVDRKSYVPPFQIGETLSGGAVGQVVASNNNPRFASRAITSAIFPAGANGSSPSGGELQKIDAGVAPIQAYLGAFGMPGLTAYAGLLRSRRAEGRRARVRVGGVGRCRRDRLPDRQEQGMHRRGLCRIR